eukprot:403340844
MQKHLKSPQNNNASSNKGVSSYPSNISSQRNILSGRTDREQLQQHQQQMQNNSNVNNAAMHQQQQQQMHTNNNQAAYNQYQQQQQQMNYQQHAQVNSSSNHNNANNQINYISVNPSTMVPSTTQSKVKKVLAFTLNQNLNAAAAQQQYQHQLLQQQHQQNSTSSSHHNLSKKQEPSPQTKKTLQGGTGANINRQYETLQSKLKNKRRQTGAGQQSLGMSQQMMMSPGGSMNNNSLGQSTSAAYAKQSQQLQEAKFNATQKISGVSTGFNLSQGGMHQTATQRKQLKLSVDNHSDSSFNNMTIKSADKNNSIIRSIPQSTKNALVKDQTNQMTPTSQGSGYIQGTNVNSMYQSHFSNNSRFTTTRPKNPTDTSSISSQKSDSLSATMKVPMLDLKKAQLQKLAKNQAYQTLRDQNQNLSNSNNQQDTQSDNQEGSFTVQVTGDNLLSSSLYQKISERQYLSQHNQSLVQQNLQQNLLLQNQQQQLQQQQNLMNSSSNQNLNMALNQQSAYKSKFTLVNRPIDLSTSGGAGPQTSKEKSKKSFQFTGSANQSLSGAESYRKMSTIGANNNTTLTLQQQQLQAQIQNNSIAATKQYQSVGGQGQVNSTMFSPKNTGVGSNGLLGAVGKIGATKNQLSSRGINNQANKSTIESHRASISNNQKKQLHIATQDSILNSPDTFSPAKDTHHQQNNNLRNFMKDKPKTGVTAANDFNKPPLNSSQQIDLSQTHHQKSLTLTNSTIQMSGSLILNQDQQALSKQNTRRGAKMNGNNIEETIQEENFEESAQNTKRSSNVSLNLGQPGTNKHSMIMHQKSSQGPIIKSKKNSMTDFQQIETKLIDVSHSTHNHHAPAQSLINQSEAAPSSQHQQKDQQLTAEEQKKNQALQTLKEQLKAQISMNQTANHQYSNPQSISKIDVDEVQYPITPGKALKLFLNNLTDYEKGEILDQKEVYFLGLNAQKIHGSPLQPHNYGYDDDRGDYIVVLKDHISYRYEVLDFLGKGSFGQALKCYDYKTNQFVALKIIRNKKRFHHQAGVELKILNYLKEHDPDDVNNIIRIKDYTIFRKHLIIGFELLNINLYEFIKNNNFRGISQGLIRRFAIQILQALKYQKDHKIIHCDLKPENILLKQPNKSGIKIIDYGSSCFQGERIYTYIQSRFYRAPEIVLGIPYSTAIDMWSFGCILAELYTGFPLFPGENEMEQLAYIMEIKGAPPDYILNLSSRKKLFFDAEDQPIIVANSRGKKRRPLTKTLKGVLQCNDVNFIDFIDKCLDWDPFNRMTPLEALHHEWILEGLPPKVLVHHQRMFGQAEDKNSIREATLQQIQGFPPDANTNTIFTAQQKQKQPQVQVDLSSITQKQDQGGNHSKKNSQIKSNITIESQEVQIIHSQNATQNNQSQFNQTQGIVVNQNSQSSSVSGQKKNRTIQLFMQELFDEKAPPTEDMQNNQYFAQQVQIEPSTFYGQNQNQQQKQSFKNQTINVSKIKEFDHQNTITHEGSALEEDMEEGAHFSQTQKIPISLIKQQEKIVSPNNAGPTTMNIQTHFYNPKTGGPKLNNYLSQASQSNVKQQQLAAKKQGHGGSFHKSHISSGIDLLASARGAINHKQSVQQHHYSTKQGSNTSYQQSSKQHQQLYDGKTPQQQQQHIQQTLKQITSQRSVGLANQQQQSNLNYQPNQSVHAPTTTVHHATQSIKIDLANPTAISMQSVISNNMMQSTPQHHNQSLQQQSKQLYLQQQAMLLQQQQQQHNMQQ